MNKKLYITTRGFVLASDWLLGGKQNSLFPGKEFVAQEINNFGSLRDRFDLFCSGDIPNMDSLPQEINSFGSLRDSLLPFG